MKLLIMKRMLKEKVVDPIVKLLRQGITPQKIALGMAVGAVVGILPVIGVSTLLCTIVALLFRLSLPAVQIVNYLVYPLQFVLLIPFFHFGAWLFNVDPLPFSATQLISMFGIDFWGAVQQLWGTTLRACVAWSLVCMPALAGLYYLFKPLLVILMQRQPGNIGQTVHTQREGISTGDCKSSQC